MRLRNPGAIDAAAQTVHEQQIRCENLRSGGATLDDRRDQYIQWVDTTEQLLRNHFEGDALPESLYTRWYWEVRHSHDYTPRGWDLLHREIRLQVDRLGQLRAELLTLKAWVDQPGEIVVPDTSALVRGELFTDFPWPSKLGMDAVRIIVPILVVEELDKLKDSERTTKAGDKARRVLKLLREKCREVEAGTPAPIRKGTTIEIFLDEDWHERRPIPDAEIIDQALTVQSLTGKTVTLTCVDASMEFRARQYGLKVEQMPTPDEVRGTRVSG